MTDPSPVLHVPVTITLGGMLVDLVVMELDSGGMVELTPDQARAIAADLEAMADEAEQ
jgi:hypothetical protein